MEDTTGEGGRMRVRMGQVDDANWVLSEFPLRELLVIGWSARRTGEENTLVPALRCVSHTPRHPIYRKA
jgi:hypothetical protein